MDDVHPDRLRELLGDHGVAFAYLFGSRAEATATEGSDHDVAVMFHGEATLGDVGRLQIALARLVGTPVDLVELDRATLELRAKVVQGGRLWFSDDEERRVTFETRTRSRWFDYRPTLEELTRAYLHRIATKGL
jgi:predicted nucleotidyltransferase